MFSAVPSRQNGLTGRLKYWLRQRNDHKVSGHRSGRVGGEPLTGEEEQAQERLRITTEKEGKQAKESQRKNRTTGIWRRIWRSIVRSSRR